MINYKKMQELSRKKIVIEKLQTQRCPKAEWSLPTFRLQGLGQDNL